MKFDGDMSVPVSFCVLALSITVRADWFEDVFYNEGFKFGRSMMIRVEDTKAENVSYMDRLALRVDYGNVGVRAAGSSGNKGIDVDFYLKDKEEARGKKMGSMMLPFIIGSIKGGAFGLALGTLKGLAIKALLLSKAALVASVILIFTKLFKKEEKPYIEVEETGYPLAYEFGDYGYGGYAYNGYAPAESHLNYVTVNSPESNGTVSALIGDHHQAIPAMRRRSDHKHRRPTKATAMLTIRRISEAAKRGI